MIMACAKDMEDPQRLQVMQRKVSLEDMKKSPVETVVEVRSFSSGNDLLGEDIIKRCLLQYLIVATGVWIVWCKAMPFLGFGWLVSPKVLLGETNERVAATLASSAVLFAHLLPFLIGALPYPASSKEHKNDPKFLAKIGVVIPCHESREEIGAVLARVLEYFDADHVVVADNADSAEPPDDTADIVRKISSRVRYLYVPQGHKTRALLHGTFELPASCEYVLHLDDDTLLASKGEMVFDESHFDNPTVSAVTFGIRMLGDSIVAKCVDLEFLQFSLHRTARSLLSTAFFCHGIVGLWRRDKWTERLASHPSMPYGEDAWIGNDTLSNDERIVSDLRGWVYTYAPDRLLPRLCWFKNYAKISPHLRSQGYGASSIWKQRARRWYTNAPRRLGFRFAQLIHYKANKNYNLCARRNLWFRVFMLIHIHRVLFYLTTPLFLAYAVVHTQDPHHLLVSLAFWVLGILGHRLLRTFLVSFVVYQIDRRLPPQLLTILAYPFYATFLDLCFMYGHWRSILFYIPFFPIQRHLPSKWASDHESILRNSREHQQKYHNAATEPTMTAAVKSVEAENQVPLLGGEPARDFKSR